MPCFHDLVPTFTVFTAFILSLLCLFAGTGPSFLSSADVMTLDTSQVAPGSGIGDFYSIYIMSYCSGILEECSSKDSPELEYRRKAIRCSDRTVPFAFDPGAALPVDIDPNAALPGSSDPATSDPSTPALSDLGFPSFINDDFAYLAPTSNTMAVFYVLGVGATGMAILVRVWISWGNPYYSGFQSPGDVPGYEDPRRSRRELTLMMIGFVTLGIASTIASVTANDFTKLINASGAPYGISADHGKAFFAMSWTATALLLISSVDSLVLIVVWNIRHCTCDDEAPPPPEPKDAD